MVRVAAWAGACLLALCGCTHATTARRAGAGGAPSGHDESTAAAQHHDEGLRYVDPALGFEIARPMGDEWHFTPGEGSSPNETVAVPVIIAHRLTGAQVVVQVAPAVATPGQFAERLTAGLRTRPGFTTTDVQPLPMADGAVGFAFTMGDKVAGRVAVVGSGQSSHVYVLLCTWPQDAPPSVISGVDEIVRSLRTTAVSD